jgi:hypothetical protein
MDDFADAVRRVVHIWIDRVRAVERAGALFNVECLITHGM